MVTLRTAASQSVCLCISCFNLIKTFCIVWCFCLGFPKNLVIGKKYSHWKWIVTDLSVSASNQKPQPLTYLCSQNECLFPWDYCMCGLTSYTKSFYINLQGFLAFFFVEPKTHKECSALVYKHNIEFTNRSLSWTWQHSTSLMVRFVHFCPDVDILTLNPFQIQLW